MLALVFSSAMSSIWPRISLLLTVWMKRRFCSATHGTYSTVWPFITQREAMAAACSAVPLPTSPSTNRLWPAAAMFAA